MTQRPSLVWLAISALFIAGAFWLGRATTPRHDASALAHAAAQARAKTANMQARAARLAAEEKIKAALGRLAASPGAEAAYDAMLPSLLAWTALNPTAALDWVRAHLDPLHREAFLAAMLGAWTRTDPQAAWSWVHREMSDNFTQLDAVLAETGKASPETAWRFATEFLRDDARREHAQTIYVSALRGLMHTGNYEQALRFIEQTRLPAGVEEFDLTSLVASEWGRFAPEKAVAWLAATPDDGSFRRQQALMSLGLSWAQSDPRAAADFAAQLPPSITRQNMLAVSLDAWAAAHPEQAGEWLIQHKQHPDFDQVIIAVATSPAALERDVNLAIAWADTMLDDDLRRMTLNRIVGHWLTRDPAAAKNFLDTTKELSPETIASIRESLPRPAPEIYGP